MFLDIDVKDHLELLLSRYFTPIFSRYFTPIFSRSRKYRLRKGFLITKPKRLIGVVLNRLKHNKIRGVRIEAKGRLTRRYTASRSVYKMRYKGGLKNVDSSFRG